MAEKNVKTDVENNATEVAKNGDKEAAIKNGDNFKTINIVDTDYMNTSFGVTLEGDSNDDTTQVMIRQSATLAEVTGIVDEIYQALMKNVGNIYALKRPFLVFYILNSLSNVDVSDVIEEIEINNEAENIEGKSETKNEAESTENTTESQPQYGFNGDKLFALSVSTYGQIIDRMLDKNSDIPYNSVYAIGQLLDKKLNDFEKAVEGYSPSDNILNEIYNTFTSISKFVETLTEKVNSFDVSKLEKQFKDINAQSLVDAYLNSTTAKKNEDSIMQAKNEQIRDFKARLRQYIAEYDG